MDKFNLLTEKFLDRRKGTQIVDLVGQLERVPDVGVLADLLR